MPFCRHPIRRATPPCTWAPLRRRWNPRSSNRYSCCWRHNTTRRTAIPRSDCWDCVWNMGEKKEKKRASYTRRLKNNNINKMPTYSAPRVDTAGRGRKIGSMYVRVPGGTECTDNNSVYKPRARSQCCAKITVKLSR